MRCYYFEVDDSPGWEGIDDNLAAILALLSSFRCHSPDSCGYIPLIRR